jgi:YHS domain-containing protein
MITKKKVAFLMGAIAVSTLAAWYRWSDSAHAIGIIRRGGGTARHPVALQGGRDAYVLIATATVIPPYRGDVRVAVEGDPPMAFDLEVSRPVVDLGLHRWPVLEGRTLRGLSPRDRVALWLRLGPPEGDPVCGMACGESGLHRTAAGHDACFCSESCWRRFQEDPARYPPRRAAQGHWALTLRDEASGEQVLTMPIVLGGKEAGRAGAHH